MEFYNIAIPRGDTRAFRFNAYTQIDHTAPKVPYHLVAGERYYFTVKKDTADESPDLIQKIVGTAGDTYVDIYIDSADTKALEYGAYVWDLRRKRPDGGVSSPIYVSDFEVMAVVGNV